MDLLEDAREMAKIKSEKYKQQIQKAYYKKVQKRRFEKGDLVLKRKYALKPTGKLDAYWEGPYVVTRVLRGGAYELKEVDGRQSKEALCVKEKMFCLGLGM